MPTSCWQPGQVAHITLYRVHLVSVVLRCELVEFQLLRGQIENSDIGPAQCVLGGLLATASSQ